MISSVRPLLLTCLVIAVTACFGAAEESPRRLTGALEDMDTVNLTEEVVIGDRKGTVLRQPGTPVVDNEGRVYVPDAGYYSVRVFSPNGDFLAEVGRRGEGPGEFQSMNDTVVGAGDSLFVYDRINARISVFSAMPELSFQYSIPVKSSGGRGAQQLFVTQTSDLFLKYKRSPPSATQEQAGVWLAQINRMGAILADSLVQLRTSEMHLREWEDGSRAVRRPFGRRSEFRPTPDGRPCYGWTGELHIRCLSTEGRDSTVFHFSHDPLPVTQADRNEVREWSDDMPGATAMIRDAGWHDTHPAFQTFTVDDEGRFWIRRPAHADEETNTWTIVDPIEKTRRSFTLPKTEAVAAVRDDRAFGLRWFEETGEKRIVIYGIKE